MDEVERLVQVSERIVDLGDDEGRPVVEAELGREPSRFADVLVVTIDRGDVSRGADRVGEPERAVPEPGAEVEDPSRPAGTRERGRDASPTGPRDTGRTPARGGRGAPRRRRRRRKRVPARETEQLGADQRPSLEIIGHITGHVAMLHHRWPGEGEG